MKSTFGKCLILFAVLGVATLILQSANGGPVASANVQSTIGTAPQSIAMDGHASIADSRTDYRSPRMAE